jgi:hypothetical protein
MHAQRPCLLSTRPSPNLRRRAGKARIAEARIAEARIATPGA